MTTRPEILRIFRGTILAVPGDMAWFDVSGGRLRFRRTSREPVREWLASKEGTLALQAVEAGIRFSLIGRRRAARYRLTRTLSRAIDSPAMRAALTTECGQFLKAWTQVAYAPALPRLSLDGRRLVVVPRTMIIARAGAGATARLGAALGTEAPDAFKYFVSRWVLRAMDVAIRRAAPDVKRPLHAEESWACVFIDPDFTWVDPFVSGDAWRGHVMMFELPPAGLTRRERQALTAAIAELASSLPSLSRRERDGAVRVAFDQMATLRF